MDSKTESLIELADKKILDTFTGANHRRGNMCADMVTSPTGTVYICTRHKSHELWHTAGDLVHIQATWRQVR